MLPDAIFASPEFIPTDFAFGILVTAFDQVAMGLALGHRFKWGLFRGIAQ